jgi:hypothetical protein
MIVFVFDFRINVERSERCRIEWPHSPACLGNPIHLKGEMAMSKQENTNPQETTPEIKVEDLPVDESAESDVKGGMETMKKAWKDAS